MLPPMAAPAPTVPASPSVPPATTFPPAQPPAEVARVRNRALLRNFFWRELTTRYLGSVTGFAWALLHPLALLGVYWFVFTMVFRAGGFGGQRLPTFVAGWALALLGAHGG